MMKNLLIVAENTIYPTKLIKILRAVPYNVHVVTSRLDGIAFFLQNTYDIVLVVSPQDKQLMHYFLQRIKQLKGTVHTGFITEHLMDGWCISMLTNNKKFYFSDSGVIGNQIVQWEQTLSDDISKTKNRQDILSAGKMLHVDTSARTVYHNNKILQLNIKEYRLLVYLLKHKEVALHRAELYNVLQRNDREVDVRIVDKYIKQLRDKLKTNSIISVRGYGYKWEE